MDENTEQKVSTELYEAFWYDEETIYFRYFEDQTCDVEDVKALMEFQIKQGVGLDHKRLVHAEPYAFITKPAREYLQEHAPSVRAEAYVLPSISQKILFNLYIKLRRNTNPIKSFDNLQDALKWLNKY